MLRKVLSMVCAALILAASVSIAGADPIVLSGSELYHSGITDYQYKAGEVKKYDEPIAITFGRAIDLNASSYVKMEEELGEPVTDNRWIRYYRDAVNVNAVYDITNASETDYKQEILLAMTAGTLPDVFLISDLSMLEQLAEAGAIYDLTEIWQLNANETLGKLIEAESPAIYGSGMVNGRLYAIPQKMPSTNEYDHLWVRRDWLNELGLEIPVTMDDVKAVAKAFVEHYADNVGLMFSNSYLYEYEAIFWAFGGGDNKSRNQWIETQDGTLAYSEIQPEMKAGLKWLNDMYESGLINAEWSTEDTWSALSNYVANNRCGIFFGPHWYGFSLQAYEEAGTMDETADWIPVGIPTGYEGVELKVRANNTIDNYICVSSTCANPEAVIHMLNVYVEKLFGDNNDFANYFAVEQDSSFWKATPIWSLSATVDLDPCANMMNAYDTTTGTMDESKLEGAGKTYWEYIQKGMSAYQYMFGPADSCFVFVDKTYPDIMLWNMYQGAPTQTQNERWSSMQDLIDTYFLKMINGEIEVDGGFEEMVEKWYALGGTAVTEEINAVYNTLK